MRGKIGDFERLFHMVKWCRKLKVVQAKVQSYEQFIAKESYYLVDVSAFYIGQIGELARTLSDEMKTTLEDIQWRQINDMRNQLIHNYGKRSKKIIWSVIIEDIPVLEKRCLDVLREYDSNVDEDIRQDLAEETGIVWEDK
ncbi:MAG: DUF86 domain-containing protein [Selenomonadaceae bacterium]|nr:DUF86 domain-containing protein [Selenomonadaceae bacterium]